MKNIYLFNEGSKEMKYILGQKGANLSEMYNEGLPIPFGFIIPTERSKQFENFKDEIKRAITSLNGVLGKDLFLSVRSSPQLSMPGMLETVLNIDSYDMLFNSIRFVLDSWENRRAKLYREKFKIKHELNSAIVIQKMVFGNKNNHSSSGVVFSSNPNNGKKELIGEFLHNEQGDKLVSGLITPKSIDLLDEKMYNQLVKFSQILELHFNGLQEIEFTIESNQLYILQSRSVEIKDLKKIKTEKIHHKPIVKGIAASFGITFGKIVFCPKKAIELKNKCENVILVRPETDVNDLDGIIASDGIITLKGGSTSHAAVVARSMGKPCICGCENLKINEFELVTINGETGEVFLGNVLKK